MNRRATTFGSRPRTVRLLVFAALGIAGLSVLVTIALVVENIRGKAAWERFRTEWTAKGEKLDLSAFIPPPVPDAENLARTPLLAPLFEYERRRNGITWRDPAGHQRAMKLADPFKGADGRQAPSMGNWETAVAIDLVSWRDFFEAHSDYAGEAHGSNAVSVVLTALGRFDEPLAELRKAAERPFAVFPIHYHENFEAAMHHLRVLKGLSSILSLRALAHLADEKSELALQDIQLGLRLADALKSEPLIISQLVRLGMIRALLQPVWEGMAQRRWNDAQLSDLQILARGTPLLESYGMCIRGERALVNSLIEGMRSGRLKRRVLADAGAPAPPAAFFPSGWLYQNQLSMNRIYQERYLPIVDPIHNRVFPSIAAAADAAPELNSRSPYHIFAKLLLAAGVGTASKFARQQTNLDLVSIATALERYYNSHGRYPDQLAALAPSYLARVPNDIISGQSLKYARTGNGRYILYSIGWNETDEQGASQPRRTASDKQGDWVWAY